MAEKTSRVGKATRRHKTSGIPVRQVRSGASPEELAAVAAVMAILASASGDGDVDRTDPPSPASWRQQSGWGSPRRMVRTTFPHGPGGWRASALSR
ncbi:MAG: acyl-CoA carboxylase subunit epsilon [Dermatophilaceae bacterium]